MFRLTVSLFLGTSLAFGTLAEAQVPAPSEVLGFEPGDDYQLALWEELLPYYEALAAASDRVELREIGETVLGKPLIVLFISSPENLAALDRHRENARALAHAEIPEEEAVRISREGKAVVWIDAGLHATEVAPSQMAPLLAHRIATEESEEVRKIRDEVILILMPCMNPDGLDIVASWYRRNLETPFETTRPPELYHHYVGHDNNRDWFMNNMPETAAVSRMLYHEWFPQIVYNHHQTGPAWARIFLPPFADPVNPRIHPGVTTSVNLIGSAMANRFAMKKMPGAVSDMIYSMWWNGGMRTVPYFHNMIGLLTETSHASASPRRYDPADRPEFVGNPRRGQAAPTNGTDVFYPYPWPGGESPFSDPIRYTLTASMAVLDVAADLREKWLFDIWRMGRDAIEGSEASWIVPADQWDPGEAAALVNVLHDGGIVIERAGEAFEIERGELRGGLLHHSGRAGVSRLCRRPAGGPGLSRPPAHAGRAAGSSLRPRGLDVAHADGSAGGPGRGGSRCRIRAGRWSGPGPGGGGLRRGFLRLRDLAPSERRGDRPEPAAGRRGRSGLGSGELH